MAQYQFLDRHFQEYIKALIKTLENLATILEAEKCYEQAKLIRVTVDILLEIEIKNARLIAAIEENIKNSLLLD